MANEMDRRGEADSDEVEASEVTIVCAWCGRVLQAGNGGSVSHGLCETCLPRVVDTIAKRLEETSSPADPGRPGTEHGDRASTVLQSLRSDGERQPGRHRPRV